MAKTMTYEQGTDGFELHCLYWPNMAAEIVDLHRRCFRHIGIPVQYTVERVRHAVWIERMLRERLPKLDVIGFVDIDCLAYSHEAVIAAYRYAVRAGSFIGLAQSSGPHPTRIYAAPSFLLISRRAYDLLGRPSMSEGPDGDVAQNLSTAADKAGFPYRVLFPIGFNRPNSGPPWRLGSYGRLGIGTEYAGGFFHNFNSRAGDGIDLFRERAKAILANQPQPTTTPYISSALDAEGVEESQRQPRDIISRLALAYARARHRMSPHVPEWARTLRSRLLGHLVD